MSLPFPQYSLARDVVSSLRKQYVMMRAFQHAPLIVLNSFSGEGMHMKLMASMFQNMFPTINITTVSIYYRKTDDVTKVATKYWLYVAEYTDQLKSLEKASSGVSIINITHLRIYEYKYHW